jgi:hypothetical protein
MTMDTLKRVKPVNRRGTRKLLGWPERESANER